MVNNKVLVVVDMQNDFIDGSLGSENAVGIVPNVVDKIEKWDGDLIIVTLDSHDVNYLQTIEGKHLPVEHCIVGTPGHNLNMGVTAALLKKIASGCSIKTVRKTTFGSYQIACEISEMPRSIELVGLCTDICVVSNALLLKAAFPESEISVDANCCAGTTELMHEEALDVMASCHIEVYYGVTDKDNQ